MDKWQKIEKLCVSHKLNDAYKLVFMWIKQNAINFAEYVEMVEFICSYEKPISL